MKEDFESKSISSEENSPRKKRKAYEGVDTKKYKTSLSIDEMNPIFHEDGTVTLHNEFQSQFLDVGDSVLLNSNQNSDQSGFGIVIEKDEKNLTLRIELID